MKTISVLTLSLIASLIFIKGQDTIKEKHIPNEVEVNRVATVEMKVDSIVMELQRDIERVKALQEEDKKYYQMELESDQMVIEKQKELILTLLKRDDSKGVPE